MTPSPPPPMTSTYGSSCCSVTATTSRAVMTSDRRPSWPTASSGLDRRVCAASSSTSRESFVNKTLRWRDLPKPTIAGVQGYCIFGGWMVASSMDIIYAADDAMFLGANFQYFSIPWDISPRRAKELLYESRFIDAAEAEELGLVNKVVPRRQLDDAVMGYARRIADNDPFQLRMTKMAVNQMQDVQGFQAHITAAHLMHLMSSAGESDPDYALRLPDGRRRPMVQKAFEHYELRKAEQGTHPGRSPA